ncbi:trans-1,2-dihydrobenzene-1,2-diol dehydrogenase isoform X1 [Agelaius tricolor]|uniref:trans-1,2-dihydrobenzene-1,2-diol dehydrogenase isoform X1 n=1 Tax=Agelaius tricolor TaxID=9191 RepID=UPI0039F1F62F
MDRDQDRDQERNRDADKDRSLDLDRNRDADKDRSLDLDRDRDADKDRNPDLDRNRDREPPPPCPGPERPRSRPGPTRWGICSAGAISHDFVLALQTLPAEEHTVAAVAARDLGRARGFAQRFGVPRAYGSYEELAQDPGVDVVYVGVVNPSHLPAGLLFLRRGRAVLMEKPMALSARQVAQLAGTARDKGVFLMEGFWTRFFPAWRRLLSLARGGCLGSPLVLRGELGFDLRGVPRLRDPGLGGGALLDLGGYGVQMALAMLGGAEGQPPPQIRAHGVLHPTGTDWEGLGYTGRDWEGLGWTGMDWEWTGRHWEGVGGRCSSQKPPPGGAPWGKLGRTGSTGNGALGMGHWGALGGTGGHWDLSPPFSHFSSHLCPICLLFTHFPHYFPPFPPYFSPLFLPVFPHSPPVISPHYFPGFPPLFPPIIFAHFPVISPHYFPHFPPVISPH